MGYDIAGLEQELANVQADRDMYLAQRNTMQAELGDWGSVADLSRAYSAAKTEIDSLKDKLRVSRLQESVLQRTQASMRLKIILAQEVELRSQHSVLLLDERSTTYGFSDKQQRVAMIEHALLLIRAEHTELRKILDNNGE